MGVCLFCFIEKFLRVFIISSSIVCLLGYLRVRLVYYYFNFSFFSDDEDDFYVFFFGLFVFVFVFGYWRIVFDVWRGNKGIIVNGLMGKSRLMGVVVWNEEEEVEVEEDGKLKDMGMSISGFWFKLFGFKRWIFYFIKMVF